MKKLHTVTYTVQVDIIIKIPHPGPLHVHGEGGRKDQGSRL